MLFSRRILALLVLALGCARTSRTLAPSPVPASPVVASSGVNATADSVREYRGEWELGFEASHFHGCDASVPANVWLTLAPGASASVRWPGNSVGGAEPTITYFLRVRAILRGPAERRRVGGGYGHLGGYAYELYVTHVLEVKPPGEAACVIRR